MSLSSRLIKLSPSERRKELLLEHSISLNVCLFHSLQIHHIKANGVKFYMLDECFPNQFIHPIKRSITLLGSRQHQRFKYNASQLMPHILPATPHPPHHPKNGLEDGPLIPHYTGTCSTNPQWNNSFSSNYLQWESSPMLLSKQIRKIGNSLGSLRWCLVSVFKQQFSVFKQHFTYFYTLFHLHIFPQKFLNNNF